MSVDTEILDGILSILRENFDALANLESLDPSASFQDDLELDSIDLVRLNVALEDHFDLRFDPMEDDLSRAFENVAAMVELIGELSRRGAT